MNNYPPTPPSPSLCLSGLAGSCGLVLVVCDLRQQGRFPVAAGEKGRPPAARLTHTGPSVQVSVFAQTRNKFMLYKVRKCVSGVFKFSEYFFKIIPWCLTVLS